LYNWHRPHSSLGGKAPVERLHELSSKTLFQFEIDAKYEIENEPIREQNYKIDLAMQKLK